MLPLEQLAGHGKNLYAIQLSLPLEHWDTLTYSVESEALRLPQKQSEEYTPRSLLNLIPLFKPSYDLIGEISQFMTVSKFANVLGVTSLLPVQGFHLQERDFSRAGTMQNGRLFQPQHLKPPSLEKGFLPKQRSLVEELNISISVRAAKKLPLEHGVSDDDSKWIQIHDRLAELESRRAAILAIGPVAQTGIWIEYGKVSKRKFRQAYYRSNKAIFPSKRQDSFAKSESGLVKRCYIGEENSKEVKAAGEAIARRNELEKISKEIKLIESKLCD
jgi:hypothetical protein